MTALSRCSILLYQYYSALENFMRKFLKLLKLMHRLFCFAVMWCFIAAGLNQESLVREGDRQELWYEELQIHWGHQRRCGKRVPWSCFLCWYTGVVCQRWHRCCKLNLPIKVHSTIFVSITIFCNIFICAMHHLKQDFFSWTSELLRRLKLWHVALKFSYLCRAGQ